MRIRILLFFVLALVLAVVAPAAADDPKQVPIKAAESYAPAPAEGVIFCSDLPEPLYRVFDSRGYFTHLGQTTAVLTIDFCELTAAGLVLHGHATRWAANGDQLYASFHETIDPASGSAAGQATFAGGTGRFAGATGSGTFTGAMDLATLGGEFAFTGTISTVGSSK